MGREGEGVNGAMPAIVSGRLIGWGLGALGEDGAAAGGGGRSSSGPKLFGGGAVPLSCHRLPPQVLPPIVAHPSHPFHSPASSTSPPQSAWADGWLGIPSPRATPPAPQPPTFRNPPPTKLPCPSPNRATRSQGWPGRLYTWAHNGAWAPHQCQPIGLWHEGLPCVWNCKQRSTPRTAKSPSQPPHKGPPTRPCAPVREARVGESQPEPTHLHVPVQKRGGLRRE